MKRFILVACLALLAPRAQAITLDQVINASRLADQIKALKGDLDIFTSKEDEDITIWVPCSPQKPEPCCNGTQIYTAYSDGRLPMIISRTIMREEIQRQIDADMKKLNDLGITAK